MKKVWLGVAGLVILVLGGAFTWRLFRSSESRLPHQTRPPRGSQARRVSADKANDMTRQLGQRTRRVAVLGRSEVLDSVGEEGLTPLTRRAYDSGRIVSGERSNSSSPHGGVTGRHHYSVGREVLEETEEAVPTQIQLPSRRSRLPERRHEFARRTISSQPVSTSQVDRPKNVVLALPSFLSGRNNAVNMEGVFGPDQRPSLTDALKMMVKVGEWQNSGQGGAEIVSGVQQTAIPTLLTRMPRRALRNLGELNMPPAVVK